MSINSKKKPEQHITEKRSHGSHYRNEVQYNGLINQGATCYLNAVLQSLFMTPEFREAVGSHEAPGDCSEENLLLQLQKLFINLSENAATTQGITRSLGIRNVYEQQDAVEYYRKILKAVGTQASKVFEGKMNNITKCGQCGNETTEISAFISILLSIDAGNDNYDMGKSLKTFFEHSKLEEDDWMYCEICDHKTETETWSEIDEYPTVLTLHLKRFDFDYIQMRYKKNECRLDVPLSLPKEDNWPVYDLYAVINHMGGYSSGHYDTIIRSFENGTWYCFDDYNVTQTSEASLENSSLPYMLMYRKSMLNPDSIKTAALNPGSIEMEVLNPDSVKTAALNPGSIKTAASNPGSIEIVALNQYSIKTAALNSDSIETAASNQDSIKTAASNPDSIKTAATNPDSIETAASNPDSIKTAALNPDSIKTAASNPGSIEMEVLNPDNIKTAALNPDSIKTAALNPGSIEMEVLNPDNIKTAASNQDSIKTAASNPDSIETAASNPDSIKMAASNQDSIKTAASNPDCIKTAASNQDSIKTAASNQDSIKTAASNPDSIKTAASNQDSIKTAASNPDSIKTAASNQDSIETAASNQDSIKTAASNPESIETAASNPDSIKTAELNQDSIKTAASNQDSIETASSNQDSVETAALNPDSIHQPMRILLMGPSRAGKSTVGNIILGGNHFPSKSGSETVTKESMVKTVENVTVVDTPNLFSLDKSSWEEEMKKCVKLSDPGPDVILWVTPISKFSEQQQGLFHTFKKRLDPRTTKRMMIIFTHGRELKKLGQRIDRFISYCKKLCKVVRCCQNRYHVIDITDGHNYTSELLEKLSEMVTKEATAITQRQLKCLRRRSLKKKTKKGE